MQTAIDELRARFAGDLDARVAELTGAADALRAELTEEHRLRAAAETELDRLRIAREDAAGELSRERERRPPPGPSWSTSSPTTCAAGRARGDPRGARRGARKGRSDCVRAQRAGARSLAAARSSYERRTGGFAGRGQARGPRGRAGRRAR